MLVTICCWQAEAMIVAHTKAEIRFFSNVKELMQAKHTITLEGLKCDARFWYRRGYEINHPWSHDDVAASSPSLVP
jgi:DNA phosphorothioation-dependent restriction protein DptG